jgi:serine protease AprX
LARCSTVRVLTSVAVLVALVALLSPADRVVAAPSWPQKLDPILSQRVHKGGRSRVVIRGTPGDPSTLAASVRGAGGRVVRDLRILNGLSAELPNAALAGIAANPRVERISADRLVAGAMERTGTTIGATFVREHLGYDGRGIGVAIIDSGVNAAHDDLQAQTSGAPRVARFVDFVGGAPEAYDDYGHGTHVAGIVAGNGYDSSGARTGIAPGAHLVVLKALDASGRGRISDVIAALDYAVANKDALGIRIVNLSVATGVYESYTTDPLTLAAKSAVRSGLVVVASAGNNGRSALGRTQYAGVTSPGNAPWVLTVGASSHMGTDDSADDTVAPFSSRGPGSIDYAAKPDLVAPGVGIESLTDPSSTLYATMGSSLLSGTVPTGYLPYMSLSGTSMSAPVVSGTVALMLQANPALTPNAVKAILQYTAQPRSGYDVLTQGAGLLNARGAVELSAYFASPLLRAYPSTAGWGGRVIWGNRLTPGGRILDAAIASPLTVTWGEPLPAIDASLPNVVWGWLCGGSDCALPWTVGSVGATIAIEADTVVWGTLDIEADTVVWGTFDIEADTVVWGTACSDPSCAPIIWNRQ